VDEEAAAPTHIVGGGGVEVIAVWHTLEGVHVAKGVSALWKRAHTHLALTARVIAARARLPTAAAIGLQISK